MWWRKNKHHKMQLTFGKKFSGVCVCVCVWGGGGGGNKSYNHKENPIL